LPESAYSLSSSRLACPLDWVVHTAGAGRASRYKDRDRASVVRAKCKNIVQRARLHFRGDEQAAARFIAACGRLRQHLLHRAGMASEKKPGEPGFFLCDSSLLVAAGTRSAHPALSSVKVLGSRHVSSERQLL
jgi:hypothetical protein